ncbi:MAG: nucleotidyl transferase AbiEii/AbiGii toxin family protein [Caldilineaceae bacterium]
MKAYLEKLIADAPPLLAQHLAREYLQARILQSLQRASAMQTLAFHGGTALRFLYDIPRYSEDLDFALENKAEAYDFRAYLRQIERDFSAEAYTLDFRVNDKSVVHKAFVRFRGLLYELGLSPHKSEVMAIKLEIDTNPPAGARLATTVLKRHVALHVQHHDRASLFAGKLHAVLQRVYPKGRDIFDLWWYLAQPDWPMPNLEQLNQALVQSSWTGPTLHPENWRGYVRQRIAQLNWREDVARDLQAFIIDPDWENKLDKDSLLSLLEA